MKKLTIYESDRGKRFDSEIEAQNADITDNLDDKLKSAIDGYCSNEVEVDWRWLRSGGATELVEALNAWLASNMPKGSDQI